MMLIKCCKLWDRQQHWHSTSKVHGGRPQHQTGPRRHVLLQAIKADAKQHRAERIPLPDTPTWHFRISGATNLHKESPRCTETLDDCKHDTEACCDESRQLHPSGLQAQSTARAHVSQCMKPIASGSQMSAVLTFPPIASATFQWHMLLLTLAMPPLPPWGLSALQKVLVEKVIRQNISECSSCQMLAVPLCSLQPANTASWSV